MYRSSYGWAGVHMPLVYVLAGVFSGFVAAVSTLAMGHPMVVALIVYSVAGSFWVLVLAALIAALRGARA